MFKTAWRHPIKPDKIITKCELMGICQCDRDNVKCNIKIMAIVNRKDNRKKYRMGVRVL
jgi:hypothetical protein